MLDQLYTQLHNYLTHTPFLIPLGVVGVWRWGVWGIKKTSSLFYKAKKPTKKQEKKILVSVITPVYNENPNVFLKALNSWKKNKPHEIIGVIDYTDKACITVFKKFKSNNEKFAKLIITKKPGKRPALADGIRAAKGTVVALVDSDTIWGNGVLRNGIAPFVDKKVAGVGTKQSVVETKTLAQKLFSIRLEQRYWDEVPFLAATGNVQGCLSGRTAFYRREVILPLLHKFVHETFWGKKVISGEDKHLTYLVLSNGWKVAYQSTAQVYTTGVSDTKTFLKQQIRWTRNSWRADLKALKEGWVFKHVIFTVYLIDRAIQPFTLLLSPVYFMISLIFGLWIPAVIILIWWHVSRGIKMIPYLKKRPFDFTVLPAFIIFNFVTAYIRLYALFTLNEQGWITRWDNKRLTRFSFLQHAPAYAATFMIVFGLSFSVYNYKQQTYFIPHLNQKRIVAKTLPETKNIALAYNSNVLGVSTAKQKELEVKKYEVKNYESLGTVAFNFDVNADNLLFANASKITNLNYLEPGIILNVPSKDIAISPTYKFNYQRIYPDILRIIYDQATNTTIVAGRAKQITLKDIKSTLGEDIIQEISPKVWYLKSSLYLSSGATLRLDKDEVIWLKLASNKKRFVTLTGFNATVLINGVQITSWDEQKNTYDENYEDGRSFIMVKDGSRMDVVNSEIAYLGYPRNPDLRTSPYGISWKMSNGKLETTILTGNVMGSKFHHNYFGAYTFGATGMTWRGNEFYANVRYGLDPHDDSNGFLVENNKFYDNGSHGLIFSKRCINNVIRNNISYNNKLHGIMLHEASNNNRIENNKVFNNIDGIAINKSSNNVLTNNEIYNNKHGVRANENSKENLIEKNKIYNNSEIGIYLYGNANNNIAKGNLLAKNKYGVYIKSNNNQLTNNTVTQNEIGFYLLAKASGNKIINNEISYTDLYPVYTKLADKDIQNFLSNNKLVRNKKEIYARQ